MVISDGRMFWPRRFLLFAFLGDFREGLLGAVIGGEEFSIIEIAHPRVALLLGFRDGGGIEGSEDLLEAEERFVKAKQREIEEIVLLRIDEDGGGMGDLAAHLVDLRVLGEGGRALDPIAEIELEFGGFGDAGDGEKPAVFDVALHVLALEAHGTHVVLDLDENRIRCFFGLEANAEGDAVFDVAEVAFHDGLAVSDEAMEDAFVLVQGSPAGESFCFIAAFQQAADAFGDAEPLGHHVHDEGVGGIVPLVTGEHAEDEIEIKLDRRHERAITGREAAFFVSEALVGEIFVEGDGSEEGKVFVLLHEFFLRNLGMGR